MDAPLIGDIRLRTADNDTMRYYIYSERSIPGKYEIRSTLASTADSDRHIWISQNFSGFNYDIDEDLGTEIMSVDIHDGRIRGHRPYGLAYVTVQKTRALSLRIGANSKSWVSGGMSVLPHISKINPQTVTFF
jgi:hypothetical protein